MNWGTHYQLRGKASILRKRDCAGYAMLMSANKDETAVHGCHCRGDMVVRMRKVLVKLVKLVKQRRW